MKKLLVFFFVLYAFYVNGQEGTKQLMPNSSDRLWLEINCSGKEFATYGAPDKSRLYVYLNAGETMYFGMKIADYSWWDIENYNTAYFRVRNESGSVVYSETEIPGSGETGYVSTYDQAVTGPNGAIINNTTITGGYTPLSFTAPTSGNYYFEFISRDYYGNRDDNDRFAFEFFDATVTRNDTVITNPGEPNKSAGRLWSKGWALTNTSFVDYPAKVYFYVFTSDEFVNKIQYQMKPYSFDFVSNSFGVDNSSSLNVIEKAQSQDGNQTGSSDISEYRIFLNDPDRGVWKTTALPPPEVKVWYEDQLIYDYDYMREPQMLEIELDTLPLEKNMPSCSYSSVTIFTIETNVAGFTTILLDIDGNGYSTAGNDRVLHQELKKGRNYILWNFRNDNGDVVSNGPVSATATFYGRGATNFPLYDVETLSGVSTKTKRPFNKLCPTLYWDDSQISDWGDDAGTGSMDETEQRQLTYGSTEVPRVWAFNDDKEWSEHNGNMNTMNAWYNAIDLGRPHIDYNIITSDTLCVNGSRPMIADVHVDTTKNDPIVFFASDFTSKFSDPFDNPLTSIQVLSLPDHGTLELNSSPVNIGDNVDVSQISNLTFTPETDWTGETTFLWNGTNGTYSAEESDTVHLFINTPPDISHIGDTSICTDNDLQIQFTVDDADDIHDPEDIDVIAYSNNLNVVPNSGIEVTGTGATRTLTVQPFGIKSGYTIIYLQAYDGVTSIIEQFAIKMSPSLEFIGDTTVCAGSELELTAVEIGADSYIWERNGTVLGTERTYTDPALYAHETGTYTLTIVKGECTSSRDFTVSISPIVTFTGDTDLCVGENLSLSADETTADEYRWERGGYEVGTSKVLNINDLELSDAGNDYTLYVRKEGCENTSDPFTISVIENTDTTLTVTGCTVNLGEDGTVTIGNSDNGIVYNAYIASNLVATGVGTGSDLTITIPAADLNIGDNIVTITADNGNCIVDMVEEANVHVNVVPLAEDDMATTDEDTEVTVDVLDNDSGLDDGGLNITVETPPQNGSVTSIGYSTITYQPDQDFFGNDSLVYQVCDADGDCDQAKVYFTVNPVDDNPVANDDSETTNEDTPVTLNILDNDTGLDDGLTVTINTDVSDGNTAVNPDNTVTYTPNTDFNGTDSFTYTVEDEDGDSDNATAEISVIPVDDSPVANDDTDFTNEDTDVTTHVLDNDSGLGDGGLNVTIVNDASNGTTVVNGDNSITYSPSPDYNGPESITYQVCDVDGDCDNATLDITVNPVDDVPNAIDDNATTNEDTDVTVDVISNDENLGDGGLSVAINNNPSNGIVVVNADNTITYTPNADFNGSDSFEYQLCDADSDCDIATVTVNVSPTDDIPVANDDAASTNEDESVDVDVLSNDEGLGDGGLTLSVTTAANHGTAVVNGSTITYTPDPDFSGSDEFTYQVCDGDPTPDCDNATVSISVSSVDDTPDAVNDSESTDEDTEVTFNVLSNDNGLGDGGLTVTIESNASHGTASVNGDNTITYTPDANYFGSDSFDYQVCDGDNDCSIATVDMTVNPVDDIPVASDDAESTNQDTEVTFSVLNNDSGLGDGDLSVTVTDAPDHGTAVVNGDNTITYTPDPGYAGSDEFIYEVCDGDATPDCDNAVVTMTIDDTDDFPVANDDTQTTDEDNSVNVDVLDNDTGLEDGGLSVAVTANPSNGTATVNPDNTITYTPDENYNGPDNFDYEVCDADGDCDNANVDITVASVDDIPVANADGTSTDEDTDVTIDVLANDAGLGDGVNTVNIVTNPVNGTANVNAGSNTITYSPNTDFYGSDSLEYEICDTDGDCDTATVTISVNSVNDIPVANDDNASTAEDTDVTVNVLSNDNGLGDGGLSVNITAQPTHGTVSVNGDNTITYTPETDYNGSDSFTYQVCDVNDDCDEAVVDISISAENDEPDAISDSESTNEDTDVTISVLDNDTGLGDGGIDVTINTDPANGSVVANADNTITYTPATDYNGSDSFTYEVSDVDGDSDIGTVNITVNAVDDNPVANDDSESVDEDSNVTISVLDNDTGLGDGGLTLAINTDPANGTVSVDGGNNTITYTPDTDYNGPDSFVYQVCDADGDCDNATVDITVNAVDDEPVANPDSETTSEDTPATVNVVDNDTGLGDGGIIVTISSQASHGTVSMNPDNTINYVPDPDYEGSDAFTYQICDTDGDCDIGNVNITITSVNDVPVAVNDTLATNEDVELTSNILDNDTGLGDGGLIIAITSDPVHANVVENGDSTITYIPDQNFYGEDSLEYQVCDENGSGECDNAKVYFMVNPVDDGDPIARDDERGTERDVAVEIDVLFNDSGMEDGGLYLRIDNVNEPANGNATVNDSTITYSPDPGYLGTDSFVYELYDYDNDVDNAWVTVHVKENNEIPVANDDNVSTHKNTQLFIDVLSNDTHLGDGGIEVVEWISPVHGSIETIDSNYVKYLPDRDYVGEDHFTYKVNDAEGDYDTASVYITITDDNNILPVANDDLISTDEDTEVTYNVLSNDNNLDDGIYTLTVTGDPVNGSVTDVETSGNISYLPDFDFYGQDSLVYEVCDLNNDCDQATAVIEVNPVDDYQPVANDDSSGTSQNTSVNVNVLMNDTGLDDGNIVITEHLAPGNGTITGIGDETVTYTPDNGYLGYDNFKYMITDEDGDFDTANVKIHVRENNLVPVADKDTASTDKYTPVSIDVMANDVPGDGDMKVTEFIEPKHGTITNIDPSTNIVTYKPDSSFTIGIDTFTYKLDDIDGDWDTAMVVIAVYDSINSVPVANDDFEYLDEDRPKTFNVLKNDVGLEDGGIVLSVKTSPLNGVVQNLGDSTITYLPNTDYYGQDSLVYRVRDKNGDTDTANVYLDIIPIDDHFPNARDDSSGTSKNTPVTVNVLMNDDGLEDGITLTKLSDPEHGTIIVNDSTIEYTPDTDYLGRDEFEYQICDIDDQCDRATVVIEVRKDNIIPVAVADQAYTLMNQEVDIHVLHNDSLLQDGVGKVTIFETASHGTAFVNIDNTVTYTPDSSFTGNDEFIYKIDDVDGDWDTAFVSVTVDSVPNYIPVANDDSRGTVQNESVEVDVLINDTGLEDGGISLELIESPENGIAAINSQVNTFSYQPDYNYLGMDTFQYAVFDKDNDSDTATVSINVKENNLVPVAVDDTASTIMNHPVTIHVLNNDSLLQDGIGGVTIHSEAEHGEIYVDQYNSIVYTPYKWYTGQDEFEYLVEDADGDYDIATVSVTIEEIPNYKPLARNDSIGTSMNESVTVDVLRNDEGLNDLPITLTGNSNPENGVISVNANNTITYIPDKDFLGYDYFEYKVTDYDDEYDSATVEIHVRENNTVPIANNDKVYTRMNTSVSVNVIENDEGLDDGMGALIIAQEPSYGEVVVNEDFTVAYTPHNWFVGQDTVIYELIDEDGDYDQAHLAVGVLDDPGPLPGVDITEMDDSTTENKTTAHFNMVLQTAPVANVFINLSSGDLSEGTLSTNQVEFTPLNWDRQVSVTVTGVDDEVQDGDILYQILTDNAVSDDSIYSDLTVENVDAVNKDNDECGIEVILHDDNTTSEKGDKSQFGLVLSSQPAADVVIDLESSDQTEGIVSTNQVVFTPSDWDTEQEITVTGVSDNEMDGDVEYQVDLTSSSTDTLYHDLPIESVELVNLDNNEIESFIPDAFSPNNDGYNDRFFIMGLEKYDDLSLKVYNRWGTLVYSNTDYQNDWDGRANVTTMGGNKLPTGTYYFKLNIKDTGETIEGSVFLKR